VQFQATFSGLRHMLIALICARHNLQSAIGNLQSAIALGRSTAMVKELNKVQMTGRLGADPEMRVRC